MTGSVKTNRLMDEKNPYKDEKKEEPTRIIGTDYTFRHQIVWKNVIGFLILHLLALYGVYKWCTVGMQRGTLLIFFLYGWCVSEGVTIGAHRLYTHRSFKASPLVRAVLLMLQAGAGQNSMFTWVRDHRLHHRYSDTDADPHNAKRGFFFCHIGWLMCKKHPYVIELGRKIDLSDIEADWMVMFQKKYYYTMFLTFALFLPTAVSIYFFGEDWQVAAFTCVTRFVGQLHGTWLVNSAAHLYGTRPYDKNIQPVDSWFVACISSGEGWHNYHHVFPWDYKAAELGTHFNMSATVIEFLASIGQAHDLKTTNREMVKYRVKRTGDGTHYELGTEDAKAMVKALGPLHPLNPSYTTTYKDPEASLEITKGLPVTGKDDVSGGVLTIRKINVGAK